jgi:hypothetical protein
MKMKRKLLFTIIAVGISLLLDPLNTRAQSRDVPKYELAEEFALLSLDSGTNLPGLGGRFTYNLNKHVALEAAGYFFPGRCENCSGVTTGHVTEGLFGVKAGQRFRKWGIFAKARPGFASFGQDAFNVVPLTSGPGKGTVQCYGPSLTSASNCFRIESVGLTHPVLDLGAVLEFYPSRRIVVRFDGGDTMIRHTRRTFDTLLGTPSGIPILTPTTDPGFTHHSFQFTAGVGFRF